MDCNDWNKTLGTREPQELPAHISSSRAAIYNNSLVQNIGITSTYVIKCDRIWRLVGRETYGRATLMARAVKPEPINRPLNLSSSSEGLELLRDLATQPPGTIAVFLGIGFRFSGRITRRPNLSEVPRIERTAWFSALAVDTSLGFPWTGSVPPRAGDMHMPEFNVAGNGGPIRPKDGNGHLMMHRRPPQQQQQQESLPELIAQTTSRRQQRETAPDGVGHSPWCRFVPQGTEEEYRLRLAFWGHLNRQREETVMQEGLQRAFRRFLERQRDGRGPRGN